MAASSESSLQLTQTFSNPSINASESNGTGMSAVTLWKVRSHSPARREADHQSAIVGITGQQRRLHDDGLQRHAGELLGHNRAKLGELAEWSRHTREVLLFKGLVDGAKIGVFDLGFGLSVRAGLAVAIDLGGYRARCRRRSR